MDKLSHKELVEIGYKWCLTRCGFAFKELVTVGRETPDVIGFNSSGTILLEAKISRTDFLKDKKKQFRKIPHLGMGDWRFYITPVDMIGIIELPFGWGLIEVESNRKITIKHNPFGIGNIYSDWHRNDKNEVAERSMMYSALRRLHVKKLVDKIYV